MGEKNTVIDLFTGVGGLSMAFDKAGADIVYANDMDEKACQIYKNNLPNVHIENQNIQNIQNEIIPDVDIVIGSFASQSFSRAGYNNWNENGRKTLLYEIVRIINGKQPRAIFLETVKGFKIMENGNNFKSLLNKLRNGGYFVKTAILNSNEYGNVPYSKERLYIVAFKSEHCYKMFEFPNKIEMITSYKDIINVQEKKDDKYYHGRNIERLKNDSTLSIKEGVFYQIRHKKSAETCVYETKNCPNILLYSYNIPMIVDNYGIRMLTPQECYQIQGFYNIKLPENVNNGIGYKYASSCSSVTVVERIAEKMLMSLKTYNLLEKNNSSILCKCELPNTNVPLINMVNNVGRKNVDEQSADTEQINKTIQQQESKELQSKNPINNEEEFTKRKVIPALKKNGCFDVKYNHGSDEYGRDIIYKYYDNFQMTNLGAAQVKFGNISGGADGEINTILNQIDDAFKMPYNDIYENKEQNVRQMLIICSEKFTRNAKEKIKQKMDKAYNVRFLEGQDIENLLEKDLYSNKLNISEP